MYCRQYTFCDCIVKLLACILHLLYLYLYKYHFSLYSVHMPPIWLSYELQNTHSPIYYEYKYKYDTKTQLSHRTPSTNTPFKITPDLVGHVVTIRPHVQYVRYRQYLAHCLQIFLLPTRELLQNTSRDTEFPTSPPPAEPLHCITQISHTARTISCSNVRHERNRHV